MEINELKELTEKELVYYSKQMESALDNWELEKAGRIYQKVKTLNWVLDMCEGEN